MGWLVVETSGPERVFGRDHGVWVSLRGRERACRWGARAACQGARERGGAGGWPMGLGRLTGYGRCPAGIKTGAHTVQFSLECWRFSTGPGVQYGWTVQLYSPTNLGGKSGSNWTAQNIDPINPDDFIGNLDPLDSIFKNPFALPRAQTAPESGVQPSTFGHKKTRPSGRVWVAPVFGPNPGRPRGRWR